MNKKVLVNYEGITSKASVKIRTDPNSKEMLNVEFRQTYNELSAEDVNRRKHRMFVEGEYAGYMMHKGYRTMNRSSVLLFYNGDYHWYVHNYCEFEAFLLSAVFRTMTDDDGSSMLVITEHDARPLEDGLMFDPIRTN